jgi:tetratricopeptide (TPR) repeat protein
MGMRDTSGFGDSKVKRSKSKISFQDALVKQRLEVVRRLRGNDDYVMAEMELSRLHQDFPENPTVLYEITKLWNQGNKHRLTIEALGSIASIDKMPAMLLFNLASARHALGQKEAAIILYERVLLLEPSNDSAMCNLANCFHENGDLNRAFKMISRAIEVNGFNSHNFYNLAQICIDQKDLPSAVKALDEALKLNPNYKESRHSLALVLLLQGRPMQALEEVNAVLRDDPEYSYALITKALALFELGRRSESFSIFEHLWNTGVQSLPVLNNLAMHYVFENRLNDAKEFYQRALEIYPDDPSIKTDLGTVFLALGEYQQGWELCESRHLTSREGGMPHLLPDLPRWKPDDKQGFNGVLFVSEQGLGDTFQFIRYVKFLTDRGVTCSCAVQPPLVELFKQSRVADQIYSVDNFQPDGSFLSWLPLMSLPHYLEVRLDDLKAKSPYIQPSHSLVNRWKQRFMASTCKKMRIALNWTGNISIERTLLKGRSFPLSLLKPLLNFDQRLEFVSLQKGAGSEQLEDLFSEEPPLRSSFSDLTSVINQCWDFHDTAAIIQNTDLLITNDTAVAHLAGSLGHPTWLLLKWSADWRWGLSRTTTPWYPTMRLFRQPSEGDWKSVVLDVKSALSKHLHE